MMRIADVKALRRLQKELKEQKESTELRAKTLQKQEDILIDKLNKLKSGNIIIAGSGMCEGGRIKHHLKHNLWRAECSVIFVGYQAAGTLGRKIVDGAKAVTVLGEEVVVRASIYTINGFSAHADRDGLLGWHRAIAPERTFLVHGEEGVMEGFSKLLESKVTMPRFGESFEL